MLNITSIAPIILSKTNLNPVILLFPLSMIEGRKNTKQPNIKPKIQIPIYNLLPPSIFIFIL